MIRFKTVMFAALGLQILAFWGQDEILTRIVMFLTYPLLIVPAFVNRSLLGMRLILAGALLNFIVIAANGGLMPVSPDAVARAGDHHVIEKFEVGAAVPGTKSILLSEHDMKLAALADRFVLDLPLVHSKVVSIGDVLIGAGLIVATARVLTGTPGSVVDGDRDA